MNRYRWGRYRFIYLGLDFADRADYTALVVAEDMLWYGPNPATDYTAEVRGELGDPQSARGWKSPLQMSARALAEVIEANNEAGFEGYPALVVREIRRFRGVGYPRVIAKIEKFLCSQPFSRKRPITGIVADRTGVGLPPIQEMAERRIAPDAAVFIHGGHQDSIDSKTPTFHSVAARNLGATAQGLAEKGQLKFNPALPLAKVAQRELENFRVNISPTSAHESYGAPKREGEHDDTVYATALACWYRQFHITQEARYLSGGW